jgi:hypothetical protein
MAQYEPIGLKSGIATTLGTDTLRADLSGLAGLVTAATAVGDACQLSGALTIAAMPWAINTDGPFIDVNGFKGILAVLSNNIGQQIYKWSMTGDGSQATVLNMCNSYNMADTVIPWTSVWSDQTSPAARAAMFNCNYWGNATGRLANVADKQVSAQPDDQFLRDCLAQLRAVRVDSLAELPAGVTDLSMIRVLVTGAGGNLVTLRPGSSGARDAHHSCGNAGTRRVVDARVFAPGAFPRLPWIAGTMTLCDLRGRVIWSGNPGDPRAAGAVRGAVGSSRGMMVVGTVR